MISSVIPVKIPFGMPCGTGIQERGRVAIIKQLDSRLRGNDTIVAGMTSVLYIIK